MTRASRTDSLPQLTPADDNPDDQRLAEAIGSQIRSFRQQLRMTIIDVSRQAGISPGMLSKIERGKTSPSLSTLSAIARALNVPVTAFFRKYEEQRDCTFVPAGAGLVIERHGSRAGHEYRLLGHNIGSRIAVEPYLVVLSDKSEVFPIFQHAGVELIYVLEGQMVYRHANRTYPLGPGDSLFFDADAPHGPEELIALPVKMLSVISKPRGDD
ncbi:MAG: helix-turn-helix domain-containing protein [Gammaproteobacteria bacterium]|jgi:transcriptional regulator with XRE-family HTH domain